MKTKLYDGEEIVILLLLYFVILLLLALSELLLDVCFSFSLCSLVYDYDCGFREYCLGTYRSEAIRSVAIACEFGLEVVTENLSVTCKNFSRIQARTAFAANFSTQTKPKSASCHCRSRMALIHR